MVQAIPQTSPQAPAPAHGPGGERRTVLVVDDMAENIAVASSILKSRYRVKVATSGEAALRLVKEAPPDLVLLDLMMPGMDGFEVLERLRADPASAALPVIFVTADTTIESEMRGFDLGCADFVTKPISPPRLLARVRAHVEMAEARRQLEVQNRALEEAAKLREHVDRVMRHDLKAPLNGIIGIPQFLLMQYNFKDSDRELLKGVEAAGYQMLAMINNSLELYKMEVGTYQLQPRAVALRPLLAAVIGEQAGYMKKKQQSIEITPPTAEDPPLSLFGETLLSHSLFSNLLKNALEAAPQSASISFSIRDEAGRIAVTLRNPGEVPVAIRDRFFDKYVTAGKQSGTGLGTYSAMMLAKVQGGRIALDCSEPGHTSITVSLPQPPL